MTKKAQKYSQLETDLSELPRFKPSLRLRLKLRFSMWSASFWSRFFNYISFLRIIRRVLSNVALAIVFFVGTVSTYAYFSNNVTPATPFLGKIESLVEGVHLATANSVKSRVELQLALAERRIAELEKFAKDNESLPPEVAIDTAETFAATLNTAKKADTHLKIKTVKNIARLSSKAVSTVSMSKANALSSKAAEKAKQGDEPDEVINVIEYKTQGISLSGMSQVAANKEPSLSPKNTITVKDLYVLSKDPREQLSSNVSTDETSKAESIASEFIQEASSNSEIIALEQALVELKSTSNLKDVASELDLLEVELEDPVFIK